MRKLLFNENLRVAVVVTGLLLLALLFAGESRAQDTRGYYDATPAADFTIDMRLLKPYGVSVPVFILFRSSVDCYISFPSEDSWVPRGQGTTATDVPSDNIYVYANEVLPIVPHSDKLRVVGANTGVVSVVMEY